MIIVILFDLHFSLKKWMVEFKLLWWKQSKMTKKNNEKWLRYEGQRLTTRLGGLTSHSQSGWRGGGADGGGAREVQTLRKCRFEKETEREKERESERERIGQSTKKK